jgi:hypothetical protein
LGHAWTDAFITHHPCLNFVVLCDGYYDFTFNYRYYGDLETEIFLYPPSDAYVDTDIIIKFNLKVMLSPNTHSKESVIDENRYNENYYTDWNNTIDVSFNNIYINKGIEVFLSSSVLVQDFHAAATGASFAIANLNLHGELLNIKIDNPSN